MFPKHLSVETPLGPADQVWATSETHIGVSGTFTVNRVAYRVRLDMHFRDGAWQRGDKADNSSVWNALMISREWDYPGGRARPEVSGSARSKIETAIVPWLAAYAVGDGAEMVAQAGRDKRTSEIASKRAQIEKLREEIAQAEQDLVALETPA